MTGTLPTQIAKLSPLSKLCDRRGGTGEPSCATTFKAGGSLTAGGWGALHPLRLRRDIGDGARGNFFTGTLPTELGKLTVSSTCDLRMTRGGGSELMCLRGERKGTDVCMQREERRTCA